MSKHFYSHIITVDSIHIALDELDLSPDERKELVIIVESSVHHVVVDTVLSELSEDDKKTVLSHIAESKHDHLWDLLKKKVDKVEDKILAAVEDLKKKLHEDIEEAKKKKD